MVAVSVGKGENVIEMGTEDVDNVVVGVDAPASLVEVCARSAAVSVAVDDSDAEVVAELVLDEVLEEESAEPVPVDDVKTPRTEST